MELNTFPAPAVAGTLGQMVEGRLHNDTKDSDANDAVKALQLRLAKTASVPTYVIMDPKTEEVFAVKSGAEMDVNKFNAWLQSGLR